MLKLLIADDEKIIRETIAHLIDWESLGISVIGAAGDGIEAYHIILDEYPDIVLTDIKMPGLSGIDLIRRIYDVNRDTRFIILSGYGEFEYAKTAMQFGVRHYLLKPCNEEQIIASVREIAAEIARGLSKTRNSEGRTALMRQFNNSLLTNIINSGLSSADESGETQLNESFENFGKYLDFCRSPYVVFRLLLPEGGCSQEFVRHIEAYRRQNFSGIEFHIVYAGRVLYILFQAFTDDYREIEAFFDNFPPGPKVFPHYHRKMYKNLRAALDEIIREVRQYETIYFTDGALVTPISNYKNIARNVQNLISGIYDEDRKVADSAYSLLLKVLDSVTDVNFLKQLASSAIVTSASVNVSLDAVTAAEFLVNIGKAADCDSIRRALIAQLSALYLSYHSASSSGELSRKIQSYVSQHLCDPQLSLKWISKNYLYMNVDYVSKRFLRETGQKFSKYLTELRIHRAKELLAEADTDKIQSVAELVGCGNNPQYFSQIFKKSTGMTPSAYVRMIRGEG